MVALREKLVEVDVRVICVVKEKQPAFVFGGEPLRCCLSSVTYFFLQSYILEGCVNCFPGAGVDKTST